MDENERIRFRLDREAGSESLDVHLFLHNVMASVVMSISPNDIKRFASQAHSV